MRYVHTNLVAKDWKKLSQFYIDVFHCTPKPPERDYSGNWLDKALDIENCKLQGIHLILPGYTDKKRTNIRNISIFPGSRIHRKLLEFLRLYTHSI